MAASQIVRHNRRRREPSTKEADAIRRLQESLRLETWGPDLIIKAFQDLDTVFFRGCLVGNCLVRWRNMKGCLRVDPSCDWYAVTEPVGPIEYRQCRITLSANHIILDEKDPYTQMWQTMLVSTPFTVATIAVFAILIIRSH